MINNRQGLKRDVFRIAEETYENGRTRFSPKFAGNINLPKEGNEVICRFLAVGFVAWQFLEEKSLLVQ